MSKGGYNPMRWSCDASGCFNVKRRPKIEVFSECFPRRIGFGDVDAMVELGGAFCLLEWKGKTPDGRYPEIKYGQRKSLVGFTLLHPKNVVFLVNGDAETMIVDSYQKIIRGKVRPLEYRGIDGLKADIAVWAVWADKKSRAAA